MDADTDALLTKLHQNRLKGSLLRKLLLSFSLFLKRASVLLFPSFSGESPVQVFFALGNPSGRLGEERERGEVHP